ncbi:GMC oxidoreductase [Fulvivirga sedimenti]|uniref:GMC family oxidoreductase n=1 Tax=Fulvivirga sedimenti TaxID=2879465 RepID=A0A9X1HW70_9BACT|nr:GMC oxidoreductase [Fulvivirga sedimenti]MCA6078776.1 GMC family oxidoreductase [Fulvivirga sedimenti]
MQKAKYDFVFVGTSFASSFFLKKALEILGPSSKILVLERGKRFPHADRLRSKIDNTPLGNMGALDTYHSSSEKIWVFDPSFGGSSNCWTGCTPRFMPSDFKLKSTYGVGSDFPISYNDLLPFYEEAEEIMQIAGPEETPWPMDHSYRQPPQILSTVDILLNKKYGNQYISQPTARATESVGKRGKCCTSAVCNVCPVNSKYTIENSLSWLFEDPRVTLKYESQAIYINKQGNMANEIVYLHNGTEETVGCDNIVLGANAVFNPHILLNSGDSNTLTGAGISEQVGRFVRVYYNGLKNVGGSSIITANGFMMYDGDHRKSRAGCLIESFNTPFIRNEPGKWRDMSIFKFIYEDLPQNSNRVIKGQDNVTPEIVYSGHSTYTQSGLDHLEEDFLRYFSFLPIEHYEIDPNNQQTEFHICGTTRMGTSRDNSVVDAGLVHHDIRNVVVAGSSVFPAISPANPTLTLSALSLMAAKKYLT